MWPKFNFMSYSMQAVGSLVPVPALGLHLGASEFLPVVKYILGIPVCTKSGTCSACSLCSDRMGN